MSDKLLECLIAFFIGVAGVYIIALIAILVAFILVMAGVGA